MRIIETDNFGRDWPDEKFVNLPSMPAEGAKLVVEAINKVCGGPTASRYWRVVDNDYVLQPGFEP